MAIDLSKRSRPQQFTAVIESKKQLTQYVYLVNFHLQNPPLISFLPGQTISLHVGEGLNRSMSISSASTDINHILMVHDVSPMGPGSRWTLAHNVGDLGTFMAPLGIFILDNSHRKKVFVATGTGIAPFRSMLLDYFDRVGGPATRVSRDSLQFDREMKVSPPYSESSLQSEDSSQDALARVTSSVNLSKDITLYWGLRHEEDVYWKEEFEELASKHPKFTFKLTLSKPGKNWKGLRGRVTEHVIQEEQNITESEFYLCGNREMVKDMEVQLLASGVPKAQVYKELYY